MLAEDIAEFDKSIESLPLQAPSHGAAASGGFSMVGRDDPARVDGWALRDLPTPHGDLSGIRTGARLR